MVGIPGMYHGGQVVHPAGIPLSYIPGRPLPSRIPSSLIPRGLSSQQDSLSSLIPRETSLPSRIPSIVTHTGRHTVRYTPYTHSGRHIGRYTTYKPLLGRHIGRCHTRVYTTWVYKEVSHLGIPTRVVRRLSHLVYTTRVVGKLSHLVYTPPGYMRGVTSRDILPVSLLVLPKGAFCSGFNAGFTAVSHLWEIKVDKCGSGISHPNVSLFRRLFTVLTDVDQTYGDYIGIGTGIIPPFQCETVRLTGDPVENSAHPGGYSRGNERC